MPEKLLIAIIAIGCLLVFVLYWLAVLWVYSDSKRRGRTDGIPTLMAVLMGPIGVILWIAMRPPLPTPTSSASPLLDLPTNT